MSKENQKKLIQFVSPEAALLLTKTTKGWMDSIHKMVLERAIVEQEHAKCLQKWADRWTTKIQDNLPELKHQVLAGVYDRHRELVWMLIEEAKATSEQYKAVHTSITQAGGPQHALHSATSENRPLVDQLHRLLAERKQEDEQTEVEKQTKEIIQLLSRHAGARAALKKYKTKYAALLKETDELNQKVKDRKRKYGNQGSQRVLVKGTMFHIDRLMSICKQKEEACAVAKKKYEQAIRDETETRQQLETSVPSLNRVMNYEESKLNIIKSYLKDVARDLVIPERTQPDLVTQISQGAAGVDTGHILSRFCDRNMMELRTSEDQCWGSASKESLVMEASLKPTWNADANSQIDTELDTIKSMTNIKTSPNDPEDDENSASKNNLLVDSTDNSSVFRDDMSEDSMDILDDMPLRMDRIDVGEVKSQSEIKKTGSNTSKGNLGRSSQGARKKDGNVGFEENEAYVSEMRSGRGSMKQTYNQTDEEKQKLTTHDEKQNVTKESGAKKLGKKKKVPTDSVVIKQARPKAATVRTASADPGTKMKDKRGNVVSEPTMSVTKKEQERQQRAEDNSSVKSNSDSQLLGSSRQTSGSELESAPGEGPAESSSDLSIIDLTEELVRTTSFRHTDLRTGDTEEVGFYQGAADAWGGQAEGARLMHLHTSPGHTSICIPEERQEEFRADTSQRTNKQRSSRQTPRSTDVRPQSDVTYTEIEEFSIDVSDSDLEEELII